jgi:cyclomaltodextrin glucanotransferase
MQSNIISEQTKSLSVNELDFREEVIYFIIVDRFSDGTSDAEERAGIWDRGEKEGLYDKTWLQWGKYWGGNLQGIIDRVEYLKALGITAVWLSPLFEQVDDMQFDRAPMHGYWTKDFKRLNPRFLRSGDTNRLSESASLRDLVDALHGAGIKLILDIVCNHSSPDVNGQKGVVYDDGRLLVDYNNDTNGFYYHYPEINDWDDEFQLIHGEMAGLATFNEKNINYRNYIKSAIKSWLDIGIDALRIDTVKHMPIWFWQEFTADMKAHKPDLFIFGEYGFGKPWDQRTVSYANHAGMSILDFGLSDAIRFAFSGSEAGGFHNIKRVLELDHVYKRANELVTFIDNHDMPRFLSICPDPLDLELAISLLFSLRGIPCVFYGTEQYLANNTDGGHDPYNRPMMESWDQQSRLFKLLQTLSSLRRTNQALSLGDHKERYLTESIYAFSRAYRESKVFAVFNKAEQTEISIKHTDLADGSHDCMLTGRKIIVQNGDIVNFKLGRKSAHLISVSGPRVEGAVIGVFQLNGVVTQPGERIAITGCCPELGAWDLSKSYGLEYVNANTWIGEIPFNHSIGSIINYKFIILRENPAEFQHENISARRFPLPTKGRVKFECTWGAK